MKNFIRNLFTEDDAGEMWDLVRISGGAGIGTFLGNSVWTVIHTGTVDLLAFGTGFAALLGGLGTAIGVKSKLGADFVKDKPNG